MATERVLRAWGAVCCAPARARSSDSGAGALDFDEEFGELLFSLGLVVAAFGVGELCDVHGAELGAAHGAELCFLIEIVGKVLVVHGFGGRGVERQLELLIPVKEETRVAESVVAIASARTVT